MRTIPSSKHVSGAPLLLDLFLPHHFRHSLLSRCNKQYKLSHITKHQWEEAEATLQKMANLVGGNYCYCISLDALKNRHLSPSASG
jgi:hypothetical protein